MPPIVRFTKPTVLSLVRQCSGLLLQQIAHRLVVFVEAENGFTMAA